MKSDDSDSSVQRKFDKIEVDLAERHVFVCIGPDCCSNREGHELWDYLKHALKKRELPVLRTKAGCLRICRGGPWMLVYPEGVWYGGVTIERCERIIAEHLVKGRPVKEWAEKVHPLTADKSAND